MCTYKDWFVDLKYVDSGLVYVGNNQPCKIEGIGSITFKLDNYWKVLLTDVRFIPGLSVILFLLAGLMIWIALVKLKKVLLLLGKMESLSLPV